MFSLISLNSVTKIILSRKELEPITSCARDKDATTVPVRHMLETETLN